MWACAGESCRDRGCRPLPTKRASEMGGRRLEGRAEHVPVSRPSPRERKPKRGRDEGGRLSKESNGPCLGSVCVDMVWPRIGFRIGDDEPD